MNDAPPSQGLIGGKYQLIKIIGKGGMGSVWEARHATLGTPSAIKFIEAEHADSAEARSRFDKEAKAAATIQSKHAIQIFDHGVTDDGKPYIVMELLQGEPLDKCIDRQHLALPEVARIIQQVCRALARAHERGIIHRDLKPENIFLVRGPDDDETIAKVLDFGNAKMANSPGNSGAGITSGTKTGAVLGTPLYMSPEQARGLRNVDHRTDVWSLGVIAFKCLTGKLPFDGESIGDLLVKICTSPVPVPSQLCPGLPPAFDGWFMRALEREPDRRFPNVTELADALCHIAGIAPRGALTPAHFGTRPVSSYGGGHPGVGMTTPVSGPYRPSTPAPHGQPTPPYAQHGPAPGAMTNAPFTSERIPGVTPSRGRLIASIIFGSLALGCILALLFFKVVGTKKPSVVAASGSAIATVASINPLPSVVTTALPLPASASAAAGQRTAEKLAEKHGQKHMPGAAPPLPSPPVTVTPPPVQQPPQQTMPFALPPIPGPPPTAVTPPKKPNRDDPGY